MSGSIDLIYVSKTLLRNVFVASHPIQLISTFEGFPINLRLCKTYYYIVDGFRFAFNVHIMQVQEMQTTSRLNY